MNGRPEGDAQAIEFFHLVYLLVLQSRLDQAFYVLKGGANLRYFFDSPRYSEDIDLDAISIEPWKLKEKVDAVFGSSAMTLLLRNGGLSLVRVAEHKQTETTQRWKLLIQASGRREPVRTKIEFSHRGPDSRRVLGAVPDRIVAPYALRAPTMLHYSAGAAIEQKILALAQRSETQARDVFDLEMLFRGHRGAGHRSEINATILEGALERLFELPFEALRDQVLPFLDPGIADLYDGEESWEEMRAFVAERLEELR
jgi:predicted nucleotidyltransferase component of viral defense system